MIREGERDLKYKETKGRHSPTLRCLHRISKRHVDCMQTDPEALQPLHSTSSHEKAPNHVLLLMQLTTELNKGGTVAMVCKCAQCFYIEKGFKFLEIRGYSLPKGLWLYGRTMAFMRQCAAAIKCPCSCKPPSFSSAKMQSRHSEPSSRRDTCKLWGVRLRVARQRRHGKGWDSFACGWRGSDRGGGGPKRT